MTNQTKIQCKELSIIYLYTRVHSGLVLAIVFSKITPNHTRWISGKCHVHTFVQHQANLTIYLSILLN